MNFGLDVQQNISSNQNQVNPIVWQYTVPNPNGSWSIPILDLWVNEAYHLKTDHEQWMQPLEAPVLCGMLTQQEVIVGCSDQRIYGLEKIADSKTGEPIIRTIYTCTGMPYALALAADTQSFFVGDYTGKLSNLISKVRCKQLFTLKQGLSLL